ncbi:DNA-binding response OmpR family regulator [Saccharothrix saharensis]|uniref:DNA-binding response OmpR family regulator n=1 Tax=Saccharothrix saharensis TaxID=571190 RepID=A0A543JNP6_9PSEU|nr:winged helix-turn-helix domain-containing protein [Saccharothrix saharensis]TQM84453.1 DNA-binding response OmpR family regulator [Saccharothrix saharensis]
MTLSVLLVDDEHTRQALGLALDDEGLTVTDAVSREDALALLGTTTFDVVLPARTDASDVTEPLTAGVLAARIRALLRRTSRHDEALRLGEPEVQPQTSTALRAGEQVHLTRTGFRLPVEPASADGRAVRRERLPQRGWGYDHVGDARLLDVHLRRPRGKVEAGPDAPEPVVTVRGVGCRVAG